MQPSTRPLYPKMPRMGVIADEQFGHAALHDLDPEFRSFSRSEKVAAVLQSLNIRRPLPVQSMYIFKVR